MVWNKRAIGTLIALIVLLLLVAVKCTAEKPKLVTTGTGRDSNGDDVIYQEYTPGASRRLDAEIYPAIATAGVLILAASGNFHRRAARLSALKNRCTASVPAVVTDVKSSKNDGHLRYRVRMYNATYRYEYLGMSYESNNQCYGNRGSSEGGPIHVGDTEEICINPADPEELFDFLAESALKTSRIPAIVYSGMGLLMILALLFR